LTLSTIEESSLMTPTLPFVSAALAAVLGLLAAALTARVIVLRVRFKVDAGDGGHPGLAQAIRAHANLAEQVPLALLLIAFAEATGATALAIYVLAAALLAARLASAWGLSHSLGPTSTRQAGAALTVLVVVSASLLVLYRLAVVH
jgi:hypothetical protein